MRRLFTFLVLCALMCSSHAQTSKLGGWWVYIGSKQFAKKWNWHHEIQYRNYNMAGDLEQLLLRTGIGVNLTENNNNLLLGYGFIHGQNYISNTDEKSKVNEHRLFQQFITKHSIGRLKAQHRYRFEERWIVDGDFKFRFRYFLGLALPLNNKDMDDKTVYLSAYNEIFINSKDNIFDRNRLYGGVGFKLNKVFKVELGYMNQFFGGRGRDQLNLVAFLSF